MRFEDLSPEDKMLVQTDLGDFDKEAAEKLATVNEMYEVGFLKLASETADNLDQVVAQMAQTKVASELKMDKVSEKFAAEYGAFIERGFFDGLCKLGQERHGNEWYYVMPFIEEKVAAFGASKAMEALGKQIKNVGAYHKTMAQKVKHGVKGLQTAYGKQDPNFITKTPEMRAAAKSEGLKQLGGAARMAAPHAVGLTALGTGLAIKGKKKKD